MMHEDHSGAADEAQAFATLLVVSRCFFFRREREVVSGFKRMVSRQCSLLPSPQEGGVDVAEQRADARTPHRGTAMAAVTKAMESDPEARQTSMRVCCGRCPSLRLVQFCWIFIGVVLFSSSGFSAMSRFGLTQNVHHVKKLELHAETGIIQVTSRHWNGTVQREVRFRGHMFMTGMLCERNRTHTKTIENPGRTHCFFCGK